MEMIFGDYRLFTNRPGAVKIKRLSDNKQLLVGEKDKYEALCRECFNKKRNN